MVGAVVSLRSSLSFSLPGSPPLRHPLLHVYTNVIDTSLNGCSIQSASWLSHRKLVLGLTGGDTIVVCLEDNNSTSEVMLRDKTALQTLWKKFTGSSSCAAEDIISVETLSINKTANFDPDNLCEISITVNRCGDVRLWNIRNRSCIARLSLNDILVESGDIEGTELSLKRNVLTFTMLLLLTCSCQMRSLLRITICCRVLIVSQYL